MTSYIQVSGKSNILIGFPYDNYATTHFIGEQLESTQIEIEPVMSPVYGDSQGGQQGDEIESQLLAFRVSAQFNLSNWSPALRRKIVQHNTMANEGSFSDQEVGCLIHRDRSFRLVISPTKSNPIPAVDPVTGAPDPDAGKDEFFYSFACTSIKSPVGTGQGTKFSLLNFTMRAWRTPAGHPLAPENPEDGLIWNRDSTGVDEKYLPVSMRAQPAP